MQTRLFLQQSHIKDCRVIISSKRTFRFSPPGTFAHSMAETPQLLIHVPRSHPILHKPCEPVSFPLSVSDKQLIANMLYSIQPPQLKESKAAWDSAAGMAANQWGFDKKIFLYGPQRDNLFEVIINPSYEPVDSTEDVAWEGCFSIPLATGQVKRFSKIRVKYYNEVGELFEKELTGWPARVWQHENDHLNGKLYDAPERCSAKHEFPTKEEVLEFRAKQTSTNTPK